MADDYIVQHNDLQPEPYLTMVRRMYMGMGFGPLPDPTEDNTFGEVSARINHGRWLVDCPGCNSALIVDLGQLTFMCVECGNNHNGGKWLRVTVPRNRSAIETELLKRPMNGRNPAEAVNRNWEPGETVAILKQENTDHGIGA
jgi:ribosomal protein L37AE/L43A